MIITVTRDTAILELPASYPRQKETRVQLKMTRSVQYKVVAANAAGRFIVALRSRLCKRKFQERHVKLATFTIKIFAVTAIIRIFSLHHPTQNGSRRAV